MSLHAKSSWAVAVLVLSIMGIAIHLDDNAPRVVGYAVGVFFGAQWALILKGAK